MDEVQVIVTVEINNEEYMYPIPGSIGTARQQFTVRRQALDSSEIPGFTNLLYITTAKLVRQAVDQFDRDNKYTRGMKEDSDA